MQQLSAYAVCTLVVFTCSTGEPVSDSNDVIGSHGNDEGVGEGDVADGEQDAQKDGQNESCVPVATASTSTRTSDSAATGKVFNISFCPSSLPKPNSNRCHYFDKVYIRIFPGKEDSTKASKPPPAPQLVSVPSQLSTLESDCVNVPTGKCLSMYVYMYCLCI